MSKLARKPRGKLARTARAATIGLAGAAVVKELRTPKGQRQWHGRIAGFVPYDFRVPTPARLRSSLWSPDSSRLFTPQVFGVGWTVNLGRLVQLGRSRKR